MDGGMKLSIQLKLSAAWAAAGATLSLAKLSLVQEKWDIGFKKMFGLKENWF